VKINGVFLIVAVRMIQFVAPVTSAGWCWNNQRTHRLKLKGRYSDTEGIALAYVDDAQTKKSSPFPRFSARLQTPTGSYVSLDREKRW
jgi:hypothetical protein